MRIGLVVDHPHRDLEGSVLLARRLVARGGEPVLVPMYQQGIEQALLGLDAIVVNYYRPNTASALRRWRADGLATFVLDTEGGVLSESGHDSPPAFASALARLHVADGVDGYLFWGEKLARAVRDIGALPAERIAVTGCPRFDLCAEPWRRRLGPRGADYVLINTNFSLINPAQARGPGAEIATMIAGGWGKGYVVALVADMRGVFGGYLACLERIFAAFPRQRFRVRPHPFEDRSSYLERFARYGNVEVNGEGNVAAALRKATSVLHLNCGSAIEAALLDCTPVQLEFLNTPLQRAHAPLPARISRGVATIDELASVLERPERLTEGFDIAAAVRRELAPYFGPLDGRAADRAAEFIMTRLASLSRRRRTASVFAGGGTRPGQVLQAALGAALGSAAVARLREAMQPARRAKRLKAKRISALLAEFAACEPQAAGQALPTARRARHRLSGLPLESILVEPAVASVAPGRRPRLPPACDGVGAGRQPLPSPTRAPHSQPR